MPELEVELDRVATGGTGLGVGPDGRVVFVTGGLPGEVVRAEVTAEHRRRIEASVTEVVRAAPARIPVACEQVAQGCGGCDWQHVEADAQGELRRDIVADCLRRLAHVKEPDIRRGPTLAGAGYRTTVRAAVVDGRAGYRAARSHRVVTAESCGVAHPLVEEILVDGRFGAATEVVIRAGARTGERLVLVSPRAEGVVVPPDVVVVGQDELDAGREVYFHEEVASQRFRISAASFFQCRPDGAEALVDLTAVALGDVDGLLVDAYCGVGLFGACLAEGRPLVGIEADRWSSADAVVNYAAAAGSSSHQAQTAARLVEHLPVERWKSQRAGAVIADPARGGLGKVGVRTLVAAEAPVFVLISCDPASLARDTTLLAANSYHLDHVTTVDLFAQTSHVETVSRFVRR